MMGHKVKGIMRGTLEGMFIHDKMVGGRHDDIGFRVKCHYLMRKIRCARGRVLPRRLADDVLSAYLRYLLLQCGDVLLIGDKVDVLFGADMLEAIVGPLYE